MPLQACLFFMFCNMFRIFSWCNRLLIQKNVVSLHAEYVKVVV